jgi:hypothetical protein
MMMHNGPSGVLSSSDLLIDTIDDRKNSMVKQHQSNSQQYHHQHHHHSHHHSDSSRSSSICSSSLSPKTSSSTATLTTTSTAIAAVPTVTATTALTDIDPLLAQHVEYELGLSKKNGSGSGSGTRKNAWGNLSYAELISKAIASSAEQRLTLSEIYDWMIKYVPFFRNKVDRISSAGWKNSIRHNLSLHNRFKRVQSEGTGKSSWWMINPDDKTTSGNGASSSSTGVKQPRRRLGHGAKSSSLSSTTMSQKRLRTPRSTKATRALTSAQQLEQHQPSASQQIQPPDMSVASVYEAQPWASQLQTDNPTNHLYEQELYSTSVNTPTTNSNGNSTTCIQSTYPYDDVTTNYIGNTSSNNNNNAGDYSYHHQHHHFHPHSHTLYQHHHGSNYDTGSTSGYYHQPQLQQQPVLNDHHSNRHSLPLDTYHRTNPGTYSLQQQQQLDPNDEQIYLRVHSTSSHSSSASLSPPTLTTNNNLLPSSSSGSSSSNYTHPLKTSSSGGYIHPTSNGTLTLYSHHHQHLSRHPHIHHPDIETLLQLNNEDEDIDDDDDDLSTLVHHHGMIDDQQQLSSFFPNNNHNHQIHSHNDASTSILRTVLKRPIVDMYNQQV